jgi:predicted NAD-dependent protein-ADP-ribosyltransferase YbiA (DUF1768 family)
MEKIIIGDVDWLRNDYGFVITIGEITYPTLEHAYQAAKTKDFTTKQEIANHSVSEARKIGRSLKQSDDFDRVAVMEALQRVKYNSLSEIGEKLAHTGISPIVMEGYDEFWGTGRDGDGQNMMGKILQKIRSECQIIYGVDSEGDGGTVPTLKDALINNPDEELAQVCQKLFDGAKAIVSVLDANDFNAPYIAKKTGAPLEQIEDAIKKVQSFQSTLTALEDILETPSDDYDGDECDCDDCDECDEYEEADDMSDLDDLSRLD